MQASCKRKKILNEFILNELSVIPTVTGLSFQPLIQSDHFLHAHSQVCAKKVAFSFSIALFASPN